MKHSCKTKKTRKAQENHLQRKTARPPKATKNNKSRKRVKKNSKSKNLKLPLKLTPPNTLNANSSLLIDIIMFLLSTTRLEKSSTNFVHILSPFDNELI
jgi:hypothetical protein